MSMKSFRSKVKGFTLVELLVVIAIIALLVAIVFPAISNALLRGRVTATSVNARNIHQAIIAKSVSDVYFAQESPFPTDGQFTTSTAYMHALVTNNVLNVSWSFFAPPGIASAQTEQDFLASAGQDGTQGTRNGWVVVTDAENLPETSPFIFTRNLERTSLHVAGAPALSGQPFIDRGFAFVTRGGAAFALVGEDLSNEQRFESLFVTTSGTNNLNNTVIRP